MPSIPIVVADAQAMDRKGIVALLAGQPDFEVTGQAATSAETVELCRTLRPAVLILDTRLPDLGGVPVIPAVHGVSPRTSVLALAPHGEERCLVLNPPPSGETRTPGLPCQLGTDCLLLAVMRGALGAVRRSAAPEDLFRAVRAVSSGNAWLEVGTASRMLGRVSGARAAGPSGGLSNRDLQVAALIGEGHCNKEIAHTLGIAEPTVKRHVGRLLGRLGLQDRLQLGLYIARHPQLLERFHGTVG